MPADSRYSDSSRFPLWKHPEKEIPEGVVTKDYDQENLIKKYVSYGLQPIFTEADTRSIWVHFLPDEVKEFEDKYFSNITIVFTQQMLNHADQFWREMMVSWKAELRYRENLRQAADGR
jgi:hypothetical protein